MGLRKQHKKTITGYTFGGNNYSVLPQVIDETSTFARASMDTLIFSLGKSTSSEFLSTYTHSAGSKYPTKDSFVKKSIRDVCSLFENKWG